MRFVPDENAALWLRDFVSESDAFDWDPGNRTKNAKHGVKEDEVESIFRQEKYIFAGRIVDPSHAEWRGLVLGRGDGGRHLALIFTRRLERLRPISCRAMRPDERRLYEAKIQEHS